jgi:hypothetical protein
MGFDFIMYARGCKEKSSTVLRMNKQSPQNTRMSVRSQRKRENGGGESMADSYWLSAALCSMQGAQTS